MKYLLITLLLFSSCTKKLDEKVISYTINHYQEKERWGFIVTFDRDLKLNGYVSFDILFKSEAGKQETIHQNLDLGVIINKPIVYLSDIDATLRPKVLSIKSKIVLYDNADYVFIQK